MKMMKTCSFCIVMITHTKEIGVEGTLQQRDYFCRLKSDTDRATAINKSHQKIGLQVGESSESCPFAGSRTWDQCGHFKART